MKRKLLILPLITLIFLSALPSALSQTPTAIVSMNGPGWTLKVDSNILTAEILSDIQVTSKSATEKELSIIINDIKEVPEFTTKFKVDTTGLTLYKQLPLTAELNASKYDLLNATHAIRDGKIQVHRPENVLNSYACFDQTGKKVAHIYGSKLIDAKGNYIWIDQELKDGILTVMLDSKWMETAAYPVTLDPTFGYTSIGGTLDNWGYRAVAVKFSLTDNATINHISAYTYSVDGVYAGIYSDNVGAPNELLIGSEKNVTTASYQWVTFDIGDKYLGVGTYWLAFKSNGTSSPTYRAYDAGDADQSAISLQYAGNLSDPFGSTDATGSEKCSIYASYEVYVEPTPTPTATPAATATTDATLSYTWLYTGLLIFMAIANILIIGYKKSPIIKFIFGIVSICMVAVAAGYGSYIVFYPLPNVLLGLVSIVTLFSAGLTLRGS